MEPCPPAQQFPSSVALIDLSSFFFYLLILFTIWRYSPFLRSSSLKIKSSVPRPPFILGMSYCSPLRLIFLLGFLKYVKLPSALRKTETFERKAPPHFAQNILSVSVLMQLQPLQRSLQRLILVSLMPSRLRSQKPIWMITFCMAISLVTNFTKLIWSFLISLSTALLPS